MDLDTSTNKIAALSYAARGWRVLPLWETNSENDCVCRLGKECKDTGKHPRISGWGISATTDVATISEWWRIWPNAHIGIATGIQSGIFVIDVDLGKGGFDSIENYEEGAEWGLPVTLTAKTGGEGRHFVYRMPTSHIIKNAADWLPGVDIRGEGGYVVVAPSNHRSGGSYQWISGWEDGPSDAPAELVDYIAAASKSGSSGGSGSGSVIPEADDMLLGIAEGSRDHSLFTWACQLRRKLNNNRGAVEVLVLTAAANCDPPFPRESALAKVDQAFKQDHSDSSDFKLPIGWDVVAASAGKEYGPVEPLTWNPGEPFPCTDLGNAMRFQARHGESVRWTSGGGWWVWDGARWAKDDLQRVRTLAQDVSGLIAMEAEEIDSISGDSDTRAKLVKWATASQSSSRISSLMREAEPSLAVPSDVWDADKMKFNCLNGTIDLKTDELLPHRRSDLNSRIGGAKYLAGSECPLWTAFVERILPDPSVRWYVQKALGYSLTGEVDAKCFFILHGAGNNGKSVFLETLRRAVFGEYATSCAKEAIVTAASGHSEHATVVASLAGARFVTIAEEIERDEKLNTGRLKVMTGGDEAKSRFMRQDEFTFNYQLKMWIGTNHKPRLSEFGDAIRNRVRFIPFDYKFVVGGDVSRPSSEVIDEFLLESAGIFNWVVEGLKGFRLERLDPPSIILEAVDNYVSGEDVLRTFVKNGCDIVPLSSGCRFRALYDGYKDWCDAEGYKTISINRFREDISAVPGVVISSAGRGSATLYGLAPRYLGASGLAGIALRLVGGSDSPL